MKVWTSHDFTGHWSVGTALVVVAETIEEATQIADKELHGHGLKFDGELVELKLAEPKCRVLNDGEY